MLAVEGGSTVSGVSNSGLFDGKLFIKVMAFTLLAATGVLFAIYNVMNFVTIVDQAGAILSAAILAYIIHLRILMNRQNNN